MHMLRFSQERRYFALFFWEVWIKIKEMQNCDLTGQLTQNWKTFFNINNAVFLSHNTLEKNLVCNRT